MPDIHVDTSGVEKLLRKLNIHRATGPDEIPSRILKEYASEITPTLTIILNPLPLVFYLRAGVKQTYPTFSKKVNTQNYLTKGLFPLHQL